MISGVNWMKFKLRNALKQKQESNQFTEQSMYAPLDDTDYCGQSNPGKKDNITIPNERLRPISKQQLHLAQERNQRVVSRFPVRIEHLLWLQKHKQKLLGISGWKNKNVIIKWSNYGYSYVQHPTASFMQIEDYLALNHPHGRSGELRPLTQLSHTPTLDVGIQPEDWWSFAPAIVMFAVDSCQIWKAEQLIDVKIMHDQQHHLYLGWYAYIAIFSNYPSRRTMARKQFKRYIRQVTTRARQRVILSGLLNVNF